MTEPTTEAGRRLLRAMHTEGWRGPLVGEQTPDAAILAIEAEARAQAAPAPEGPDALRERIHAARGHDWPAEDCGGCLDRAIVYAETDALLRAAPAPE